MYKRKTEDVFDLEIDYGHGHGFETVHSATTLADIRQTKKEYEANDQYAQRIRIRKYREKIVT